MESSTELPMFDDFLLYIKTQNYSDETVYNYERDLKTFRTFLSIGLGSSPTDFGNVNKQIINQYKAYLYLPHNAIAGFIWTLWQYCI